MSEFVMAYSSIPNQKLQINEGMMKKILNQQQFGCFEQAKQFTKMFTNVQLENVSLSSESTACNSQVVQQKKTEEFRYHMRKSMVEKLQRIHRSPGKEKKIIRTTIPKIKQNNISVCDSRADLVNIKAQTKIKELPVKIRSNSYNDKSYYSEILQFRQKNKPCVELLEKIKGNSLLHDQQKQLQENIIKTKKLNITQVKDQIKKLICNQTQTEYEEEIEEQEEKQIQPNYMFIEDDRDRFGKQLYPISIGNVPFPGPGQYDTNTQSLEYRIQKLNERNQQRRLIQIWQQQI